MDWRDNLRAAMERRGVNAAELAKQAGLGASSVYDILERRPNTRITTIEALARALNMSVNDLLSGNETKSILRTTPVVGRVAAGLWYNHDDAPDFDGREVPVIASDFPSLEHKSYQVSGPSMNKAHIEDGCFVIVVPYFDARMHLQDRDLVVVERRRGGEIERSVKRLHVTRDRVEVRPESTDPRFVDPIVVATEPPDGEAETTVEVVGLVVGIYRKPV